MGADNSLAWSTHPWVADAARGVRFGVDLGPAPTAAASVEWAQLIEELGFDSFWLRDHPARAPEDPFTYLAAIAARTTRIRLGTLVACVQYRHPMLLSASRRHVKYQDAPQNPAPEAESWPVP